MRNSELDFLLRPRGLKFYRREFFSFFETFLYSRPSGKMEVDVEAGTILNPIYFPLHEKMEKIGQFWSNKKFNPTARAMATAATATATATAATAITTTTTATTATTPYTITSLAATPAITYTFSTNSICTSYNSSSSNISRNNNFNTNN